MRARLSIEDSLGSKKPFLYMTVKSRDSRLRSYTKAFIDTGSPHGLILNMLEAKKMQFSFQGRGTEITRLGGHKIQLFSAGNTTLLFKDAKNHLVTCEVPAYYSYPTGKKEDKRLEVSAIPNILGVEFLELNRYALFFYPHRNAGALTDEM
jgi:hypothetical protein